MLATNEIHKEISDLRCQLQVQDINSSIIIGGQIDILNWCIDKVEEELYNKIDRLKEEMLCLKETDLWYMEKKARIHQIKKVLNDD